MSDSIRKIIRETVSQWVEERIPNPEADEYVDNKQNFLGSHTYGENIGGLDKMYVAYSYGEQHPLFVWVDKEEFKKLRPNESKNLSETEDDGSNKRFTHMFNSELKHEVFNEDDEVSDDHNIADKKGPWFYNERPYYVKDKKGRVKPNRWTYKHLRDLKPNEKTQARDTMYLIRLIADFKKKYNVGDNSHTDLEPGEK